MSEDLNSFHTTDWIILVVYIVFCLAVGIYTGKSGDDDKGKSSGAEDYLLAGKQKHFLVVAVSLVSGLTSGISFLGSPGYSYTHGLSLGFSCFSVLIAAPVIMFIIMPFFGKLNLITAYSYLSLRFSNSIRLLASLVFTTRVVAYLGLVLFAPSIAIKALTGLHESVSVIVVGILTTAYTMKGGMNAVVWTDFIQSIVLIAITIYIVSKCLTNVSSRDFQDAVRVDSKFFEFDPTRELTFWSAVIGVGINSIAQGGTDQVAIQRYLTTSNMKQSIRACFFAWMMNGIYCGFLGITGVALYAFFHSNGRSDPVQDGAISSEDMIIAFFTSHELQTGSAGLLVAAIVGCSLSVVGAGLNAASTCLVIDIVPIIYNEKRQDDDKNLVRNTRRATLTFGLLSIGCALVYMVAGSTLIELNQVVFSMVSAPLLTLFLLGIMFVRTNTFGAWFAIFGNCFAMIFIVTGLLVNDNSKFPKVSPFWYTGFITLMGTLFGRIASEFSDPPNSDKIHGLTIWTRSVEDDDGGSEDLGLNSSSMMDVPLITSE